MGPDDKANEVGKAAIGNATMFSEQAALKVNELGGEDVIVEAIFRAADKRERVNAILGAEFQG